MTHIITLSVETEMSETAVRDALVSVLIWGVPDPDAMKVQVLDDHGPERRAITLENISAMREALQVGQEMAEDLLARHDLELGRTTRSNRRTAELLEEDIDKFKKVIKELQP